MIIADWVALGLMVLFLALGAFLGFGKGLKFFTGGIFGFAIGVIVCVLLGTVFLDVPFVRDLLDKLAENWKDIEFLNTIHLDVVIYYVVLFLVVQLIRILIVWLLKSVLESQNGFVKFINRTLGAVFFLAIGVLLVLLIVRIVGWVGGDTALDLYYNLKGSALKLDKLYEYITNLQF